MASEIDMHLFTFHAGSSDITSPGMSEDYGLSWVALSGSAEKPPSIIDRDIAQNRLRVRRETASGMLAE